jgi:hypothetical protein
MPIKFIKKMTLLNYLAFQYSDFELIWWSFFQKTRRPCWIRYLRFITRWVSLMGDYFKQRYIAGSAKCSTKPLSKLVTCIQSYCDTSYSWDGVNQMWFWRTLKICKEYIEPSSLSSCNIIKTFDYSTLYTTISHSKLKNKLREYVQLCFNKKNGQRKYKYLA